MRYRPIVAFVQLLVLAVPGLLAQRATARVLIAGGSATDLRGVRSGASAVAPSVMLAPDPPSPAG